jgi:predicted nucleic acid-binding protein
MTFPQVFCAPAGSPFGACRPLFTDDVIYGRGATMKIAMFQLVVLLDSAAEANIAIQDLASLAEVQMPEICLKEATFFIVNSSDSEMVAKGDIEGAWRLVSEQEYDVALWHGLPEPVGYDAGRLRRDIQERYVIIRPDRFIFAACRSSGELALALKELGNFLSVKI